MNLNLSNIWMKVLDSRATFSSIRCWKWGRGHTFGWTNNESSHYRLQCKSDSLWNKMASMLFGQFGIGAINTNNGCLLNYCYFMLIAFE